MTVLTIMAQIGCSESDMVQAFGKKWVSFIEKELPFARPQKFYVAKLVSISSIDMNELTEKLTLDWANIITKSYRSRAWRRLLLLIIKSSETTIAKIKAKSEIDSILTTKNSILHSHRNTKKSRHCHHSQNIHQPTHQHHM